MTAFDDLSDVAMLLHEVKIQVDYVSKIIEGEAYVSEYKICAANQSVLPLPCGSARVRTVIGFLIAEHGRVKKHNRSVREMKCASSMEYSHASKETSHSWLSGN
jgi:hypothetical protein